jgi:hypothetical protein
MLCRATPTGGAPGIGPAIGPTKIASYNVMLNGSPEEGN